MIEIIEHCRWVSEIIHYRHFSNPDVPGAGYLFESDADGNIDFAALTPVKQNSYRHAVAEYIDRGVRTVDEGYRQPSIGRCACGKEVELPSFTNTCECGREYNSSGQELAPRSQWGWDTGEVF